MLIETRSSWALQTLCTSPRRGETAVNRPGVRRSWGSGRKLPSAAISKGWHSSATRIMPIRPQTVWSCTGVSWPGPQTKLTTGKRSLV